MRNLTVKLMAVAMFVASLGVLAVGPALADGGSPMNSTDGRLTPTTNDRVMVYRYSDYIQIWGVDNENNGVNLTTFTLDELTSTKGATHVTADGTITLKMITPAQTHWGYQNYSDTVQSLIIDADTVYQVSWSGGFYGADGVSPAFIKTFATTYLPIVTPAQ